MNETTAICVKDQLDSDAFSDLQICACEHVHVYKPAYQCDANVA